MILAHRRTTDPDAVVPRCGPHARTSIVWRRLRHALASAITVFAVVAGPMSDARAQNSTDTGGLSAVALDSVRTALGALDWNERHAALARLNAAYPDTLPAAVTPALLALLSQEGGARAEHAGDEEFGEYVVDLVLTAIRTGDPRVVPGVLRLDGLGISPGVAAFVAGQGPGVFGALDSLAQTREDRAADVIDTYALMYARFGSRLRRADSAQVLRKLVLAATHPSPSVRAHLAYVAAQGRIFVLLPAVAEFARSDSGQIDGIYVVRQDALAALPTLQQAGAAVSAGTLLNRLTLLTEGACYGADQRLRGQCVVLAASLGTATWFMAAGQPKLAAKALDAYQRTAQRIGADGLVPRLTAVTLDGTARAVMDRM